MDKKYTGYITKDGVLHLYEAAEDLRRDMGERHKDWGQVGWIHGVEFHGASPTGGETADNQEWRPEHKLQMEFLQEMRPPEVQ